jgi:small nuclear ribonucleoprotein (snRNP)-like protein
MVTFDQDTNDVGEGESAKDQFNAVLEDATNAVKAKNRSDLTIALEHARAIAGQLEKVDQDAAWPKIDVFERELNNL